MLMCAFLLTFDSKVFQMPDEQHAARVSQERLEHLTEYFYRMHIEARYDRV